MRSTPPIAVVGSLNADLVVRVPRFPAPGETIAGSDFERFPGGKGANQAYGVARLGGAAQMVGLVGRDDHGQWLTRHLAAGGVDTTRVLVTGEASTGVALITIDASGQNHIVIVAGTNGLFTPERLAGSRAALRAARVLLLQLEIPLDTVMAAAREARSAGATVVLDPAPARELPDECLAMADLLTPNETELAVLTGGGVLGDDADRRRRMAALRQRGAARVLLKAGAAGGWLLDEDGEHHVPAHRVDAVDTTAAGDAFNAALAVVLAEGGPLRDAMRIASAAGALSVTRRGAQPSMPTRGEVTEFLARLDLPEDST
jgi:ribokinase